MQKCSSGDCLILKGIRRYKSTDQFYCPQHYHATLLLESLAKGCHVLCVPRCLSYLSKKDLLEHYVYLDRGICPNCEGAGQLAIKVTEGHSFLAP